MTGAHQPPREEEVWYHGVGRGAGGRAITIEDPDGHPTGLLRHVPRHSPTGMTWGYQGSGPADTARSLLLAALGDQARCPDCQGSGRVTYHPEAGEETPVTPYDPARSPEQYAEAGLEVSRCWNPDCDEGYRRVLYQEFKRQHVATWGEEWRMSRRQILGWLRDHEAQTRDTGARGGPPGHEPEAGT